MSEKIMSFANFNITFGKKEEPMLKYFTDIVFPAFTSGYVRGKENEFPIFSFTDVEIKEYQKGKLALVGNFVKETEYKVQTVTENGKLIQSPANVPTSPYSRFIIFLENHRMILVKNESFSPDIRSFQRTVTAIINKFLHEENKLRKEKNLSELPIAIINIIDTPSKADISAVLSKAKKIEWLNLRFFPLNNDIDRTPILRDMRDLMKKAGSDSSNWKINSPDSKGEIINILDDSSGLVDSSARVIDENGQKDTITPKNIKATRKIIFDKILEPSDDKYLIALGKENEKMNIVSEENNSLFESLREKIHKLIK